MKKLILVPQRIGHLRIVRPLLDGLLLLITFYFFLEIRAVSEAQNLEQKQKASLHKITTQNRAENNKTKQRQPLYIEEHHATEDAMWQAWEAWLQSTKPKTGQCLFDTRYTASTQPFYLLCFGDSAGNATSNDTGREPKIDTLTLTQSEVHFPNRIFVDFKDAIARRSESPVETNFNNKQKVGAEKYAEKPVSQQPSPTYKVQGWIDTPQGQLKFDPVQKKWVP